MRYIVFVLYALSSVIATASLVMILLCWLKDKNKTLLYYLFCMVFFFIHITLLEITYISYNFIFWVDFMDNLPYRLLYFGSIGAILYLIPYVFHLLLNIRFTLVKKTGFALLAGLSILVSFVPYFFTPLGKGIPDIMTVIVRIMGGIICLEFIYAFILSLFHFNRIQNKEIKVLLLVIIMLLGITISLRGLDLFNQFLFIRISWNFSLLPILIIPWNLASMVLLSRFYFLKRPPLINGQMAESFIEKYGITGREKDIILLLSKGLANKQIGDKLDISPMTVKNHIYNIFKKAGVQGRVELLNKMKESA